MDSLVIANAIELLGGGVQCTLPQCQNASGVGAVFQLAPGYDQGAPQPVSSLTVSNILDGDSVFGTRAGNRTITLPIVITAPDYPTLSASRETLLKLIDQPEFTLTWTRDNYGVGLDSPALVTNGTFESGVSGWTASNGGTLTQSAAQANSGSFSGLLTPNGTTALPQIATAQVAVAVGQGAGFSTWVFLPVSWQVNLIVQFFDASHTHLTGLDVTVSTTPDINAWQQLSVAAIAPVGAAYAQGIIQLNGTPAAATTIFVDDVANLPAVAFTNLLALPMIYNCYRANPASVQYSSRRDRTLYVGVLTVSFPAFPYGKSSVTETMNFASPLQGAGPAPPPSVVIETFQSGYPARWIGFGVAKVGTKSAQYTGYKVNDDPATYAKSGLSLNLTGMNSVGMWIGFSADPSVWGWNYLWGTTKKGAVHIVWTMTDNNGRKINFGKTYYCHASMKLSSPRWQYITCRLPDSSTFNWANVASWSIFIANWHKKVKIGQLGEMSLKYTVPTLDQLIASPATLQTTATTRGALYQLSGIRGTSHTPLNLQVQQPSTSGASKTDAYATPGVYQWTCPLGITSVDVRSTGSGGNGGTGPIGNFDGGGGGGGGGTAHNATVAVTPFKTYTVIVSAPGSGTDTSFQGDTASVIAHSGANGQSVSVVGTYGTGGAGGAAGTGGFAGGAGSAGNSGWGSGAGGSSAGTSAAGNNAVQGTGGAAVTGGGKGGNARKNGGAPGGGGGGGGTTLYVGGNGQVLITYVPQFVTFKTALLHLTGPNTPPSLNPLVNVGDGTDIPDGNTEYAVVSTDPAGNAMFGGTYSVMLVSSGWDSPASSRTVTVTVKQYAFAGATPATKAVTATITPNNLPLPNGFFTLGEMTLPIRDVPPDNILSYFTITVQSSDTADSFSDCIFVDTSGQLVLISGTRSYLQFYVDEPATNREIGRVLGTTSDRDAAESVLDSCLISGGPLRISSGADVNNLLAYCVEGAPTLVAVYTPSWFLDRTS